MNDYTNEDFGDAAKEEKFGCLGAIGFTIVGVLIGLVIAKYVF